MHGMRENVKWQRVWVTACLPNFPRFPNVFLSPCTSRTPHPSLNTTFTSCGLNLLLTLLKNYKPKTVRECMYMEHFSVQTSSFLFFYSPPLSFYIFSDLLRNNFCHWFSCPLFFFVVFCSFGWKTSYGVTSSKIGKACRLLTFWAV